MSFFQRLGTAVRRRIHQREIAQSLARFEQHTGTKAEAKERFADTGSFRSQVDRLFALGNAAETEKLTRFAESAVANTVTNRYYRPADYLSDVLDDLERHTFLTGEPEGEPPLPTLSEPHLREAKLEAVQRAWLVPIKVGAVETSLATYAGTVGRRLPYPSLQRFERGVARLFALVDESERKLVEERLAAFLQRWRDDESTSARFDEPADAVSPVIADLTGESAPDGVHFVRKRRHDQPLRLSTVVPEDRQHYLRAALARWEGSP